THGKTDVGGGVSSGYDSGVDDDGSMPAGACIFGAPALASPPRRLAESHHGVGCSWRDARGGGRGMIFHLKQGDTLPVLEAQLFASDGVPLNLQGMQVRFRMGCHVDAPAEIVDGSEGRVRYRWRPGDAA